MIYEFGGLDEHRWRVVEVPDGRGGTHRYRDRNARVRVADGRLYATVNPFTRFHDSDPRQNNAKLLYLSTERVATPGHGVVVCEAEMAVLTHGQIPFDLVDAYGTLNVVDFRTGMVLNCAATNDTVYLVVERLPVGGGQGFRYRVVLDVPTTPGQPHRYAVGYRRDRREAVIHVDGALVYRTRTPVAVHGFQLGVGIFSARDLDRYPRHEREHGQGASVRWGPWEVRSG
ncbi:PE-PGRS family protein [Plantactinospora sp. S1510]|uniref:PE-PGRS family protein n=1 Tax=Plantactinospora alkalitolerans TaxID=2789879 RepID=A0ABS0H8I0_9ACTN|nr:DUF6081 family protein [Plantactinospora alkalitolerans]MBF9134454.1 PE-PGRS family protein [Plantactinospora alkalitolerans]